MESYTIVDYANPMIDRIFNSGYCLSCVETLLFRGINKKNVIAQSSVEAEFMAMPVRICELLWMKQMLEDLKIQCEGFMKLFCDDKPISSIAYVQHDNTKHIKID